MTEQQNREGIYSKNERNRDRLMLIMLIGL